MKPGLTIRLTNDLEAIAFARMILRRVMPPLDEVQEPLFYGALTEIITNAIEEHDNSGCDDLVELHVVRGDHAAVSIRDRGKGFDPSHNSPRPDDSGLGLIITRAVIPGLHIDSGTSGTVVTLPFPEPTR